MSTPLKTDYKLLLVGIGPRLGAAILITAILWVGFHWATSNPGAL